MNIEHRTSNIQQPHLGESSAFGGRWLLVVGRWALFLSVAICAAASQDPLIPEAKIVACEQELKQSVGTGISAVTTRRACKMVIRDAQPLLEASPGASNRFDLLKVLFEAQQRLLTLEATEDNRNALFETCEKLSEAPDDYAESRLDADLLLSERDLAEAEALVADRVKALKAIMEKYRGTSAELRSLTIAALIASKLQAFDFQKEIQDKLKGCSFGGDHKAIAFRRRSYSVSSLNVLFSGIYETTDGSSINFPFDRLGHQYLVIFWSQNSEGLEGHELFLSRVREQQERFPDSFEVYSFNLDRLPDAGRGILARAGLACTAFHLPEGRSSSVYNAYALTDPVAIFVNAQGHVTLRTGQVVPWPRSNPARGEIPANPGPGLGLWLDDVRYLAQLRSLFIGDFLVAGIQHCAPSGQDSIPAKVLQDMLKCFTPAPMRYRLTQKESLANYRKAEKMCSAVIKKYEKAADIWSVRNIRIISLLGMWSLARNPDYLEEAVREARTTLSMGVPAGKGVVAQFCLAKEALRSGDTDTEAILEKVAGAGSGETAAVACAAAAIVAIEANAEIPYREYRRRFLGVADEDDSRLWDVLSFFRDRHHDYRLFWPNPGRWGYTRKQRYKVRQLIAGFGGPAVTDRMLTATLKEVDGGELKVPEITQGEMMGIVFVEPPEDESDREAYVKRLKDFAGQFSKRDVPLVAAFLSEDIDAVKSLVKECGGKLRPAILPGGLKHPLIRQLGILSADRMPIPFLLHGDGKIAWSGSGLKYAVNHTAVDAFTSLAIGTNIEKLRTDRAFGPLLEGSFKQALVALAERLPPKMALDAWSPERLHGRALAYMGLKEWDSALKEIDNAISRRQKDSRYGRHIYQGTIEMHVVRAILLKKLGRANEAESEMVDVERDQAWLAKAPEPEYAPSYARNGVAVGVYDDLLKKVRVGLQGSAK